MIRTIALLTDFGLDDHYVGVMKGVILNISPGLQLVDIAHNIAPQDIVQGALTLKSAYRFFPKKTIFVAVVDPGVGSRRKPIILKTKDYLFVAPDNGLLWPIAHQQKQTRFYEITNDSYFLKPVSNTFHGRDIFAPIAAYLAKGVSVDKLARKIQTLTHLTLPQPLVDRRKKTITGEILRMDRFGNLITNIEQKHLKGFERNFAVQFKGKVIRHLSRSYSGVKKGQVLATIESTGCLEIAVNKGCARQKFKAHPGDPVKVIMGKAQ